MLVRCRLNRLCRIDRATGEPLRRYEHDHPGSLIHVDVTKFGNIPTAAAGATSAGCKAGSTHRQQHPGPVSGERSTGPGLEPRTCYTVIDDHSRVAYAEICGDERAATAIGVLNGAVIWYADRGVTVSANPTRRPHRARRRQGRTVGG
ncbi:MAG: DDE-type integrase/transposase/recombinase [Actinomycetota bacterium]|nr:DDE-type integrase/transposase/recombinase [Actinomycetota bacterium]